MKTHTKSSSKLGVASSVGDLAPPAKSGTVIPAGTATVESLLREADTSYQSAFAKIRAAATLAVAEARAAKGPKASSIEVFGWIKAAHMQTVSQFAKHVKQQFFENVLVVLEPNVVVIDRKETKEGVEPAVRAIEMTAKHGTATAAKAVREHLGIGAAPRDTAKQPSPVTTTKPTNDGQTPVTTTKPTNDGQTPVTGSGKGADLAKAACALSPMDWLDFVKHMEAGGWHITKAAAKASKARKPAKQAPVPTSAKQLGASA